MLFTLTRMLALELAPDIAVNAVAPGTIDIRRNRETDPQYPEDWLPYIPMGRVGRPEEIAGPVLFLASEQARWITGQLLYVGGGWRMGQ